VNPFTRPLLEFVFRNLMSPQNDTKAVTSQFLEMNLMLAQMDYRALVKLSTVIQYIFHSGNFFIPLKRVKKQLHLPPT
jgi:hypothetical protein